MTLSPGATLGRYQILAPIGQGGMATVYRAYQPALDRVVVLKVIRTGLETDPDFMERFAREAKSVARLRHPHIVQVFDFEQEPTSFMAMEYLDGGTLKGRLDELARESGRLPQREAARIVSEVADALGYAAANGIIHRDIKPSNILLTRDGKAVVGDFGIAKILAGVTTTQTGVGIGTPEYMSPEQGQGLAVDQRSDLYSLGAVAYELLTGQVPFRADTPLAVVFAHVRAPIPLPSALNPQIGPQTERALLRALAKAPEDRFTTAPEFAERLTRAINEDDRATAGTVIRQQGPVAEQRRALTLPLTRTVLAAGIVAALVLIGGGATVLGVFGTATTGPGAPIQPAPITAGKTDGPRQPGTTATNAPVAASAAASATSAIFFATRTSGSNQDLVTLRQQGDASKTNIGFGDGTIELKVTGSNDTAAGSQATPRFPSTRPASYVGEIQFSAQPGSSGSFGWLFNSSASANGFHINLDLETGMLEAHVQQRTDSEPSLLDRRIVGFTAGRTVTLGVVLDSPKFSVFVDGEKVLEIVDDRVLRPVPSLWIQGPGVGAVTVRSTRYGSLGAFDVAAAGKTATPSTPTQVATVPTTAPVTARPATAAPTSPPATGGSTSIGGRVVNAATGQAVFNVSVIVSPGGTTDCCSPQGQVASTTTTSTGTYLVAVPNGSYRIWVAPDPSTGLVAQYWRGGLSFRDGTDVVANGPAMTGIDFSVSAGFLVTGTVTDAGGRLLVGGVVAANVKDPFGHVMNASTKGDGSYAMRLPNGVYRFNYWASCGAGCPAPAGTADVIINGTDVAGVNVQLR